MCFIQYFDHLFSHKTDMRRSRRTDNVLSRIYLKTPVTEGLTEEQEGKRLSYGLCSVQGWRKYQEDSHLAIIDFDADTSLFAVFDGHSGPEVALYASEKMPQLIKDSENYRMGDIEEALREVFVTFDDLLLTENVSQHLLEIRKSLLGQNVTTNDKPGFNSGCCALVVVLVKDRVYVANIGDSRCVLSRNGKTVCLSSDHKPTDRLERQRIARAGGRVSLGRINGGLNISRAFGDHQYKQNLRLFPDEQKVIAIPDIEVKQLKAESDHFLVLACDGIWNSMSNQDVINFVSRRIENQSLVAICKGLTQKCVSSFRPLNGVGGDNMTVIIVKFGPQF